MKILLLLFLLLGVEQEVIIWFRGDIDGSGHLNISDPVALSNYLFAGGPTPPTCPEIWDANNDGSVNSTDPTYILNYLFSGGPSPSTVECPGKP